jgi:hypothetical protein
VLPLLAYRADIARPRPALLSKAKGLLSKAKLTRFAGREYYGSSSRSGLSRLTSVIATDKFFTGIVGGTSLWEVEATLTQRTRMSGLEDKASRKSDGRPKKP